VRDLLQHETRQSIIGIHQPEFSLHDIEGRPSGYSSSLGNVTVFIPNLFSSDSYGAS